MDEVTAPLAGAPAALVHAPQPPPLGASHREPESQSRGRRARGRARGGRGRDQPSEATRLQRPKVQMMPRALAEILEEPKIALMHRVVSIAGPDTAWKALMETMTIEQHGGLSVNAEACGKPAHMLQSDAQPRRRTKGGVFLTMLKAHVPKETYKKIFEVEESLKKKRKKQMRQVKYQKMETKINALPLEELFITKTNGDGYQNEEREEGEMEDDVAMAES